MRYATVALIATLLLAATPFVLLWKDLRPPEQPAEQTVARDKPPEAVLQFEILRREYEQALLEFHKEMAAAGLNVDEQTVLEMHPGRQFILRFLQLAEKHVDDPICSHIVMYAMSRCAGPHMKPEYLQRAATLMKQHRHHAATSP
jgi:hypothetical protein